MNTNQARNGTETREILAETVAIAIVNAPIEKVDLTQWLFTVKDEEYQSFSKAHIAGGTSFSNKGKRLSINVEMIADTLLVQHYIEDISSRDHCRVNSVSDSISPFGKTKMGVTWELTVTKRTNNSCELSNRVILLLTEEFSAAIQTAGITDLSPVKQQISLHAGAHNEEETPLFARDIERKALSGAWTV